MSGQSPDWEKLVGEDEVEKEKRRKYLKRQVRLGKLPRAVFAREGRKMEMERRPHPNRRRYPRGKLTWRTISIYEAIG